LTGVHVAFDEIGEAGERQGVTRARLQPDVERGLRRAGLRVLTPPEALASVGVLASGIAHQIRNPLAGIRSTVQGLLRKFRTPDLA